MFRTLLTWLLAVSLVLSLGLTTSCNSGGDHGEESADTLKLSINDELIKSVEDVVVTVPSPLELSSLLQRSGANFNEKALSAPNDVSKYTTTFKQAVNLGVYGADLGYVTYFKQTQLATNYLRSTTNLANSLSITGAFETSQLERVERNLGNRDSILYIITEQFEATETHLKQVQRADIAALIIAGGWIEGLHLAGSIQNTKDNPLIRTRIGELKLSLISVISLLSKFKDREGFQGLIDELMALDKLYTEHVKISYDVKPAKVTKPAKGENSDLVKVEQGTTSSVEVSEAGLKAIIAKGEAIRKSIVS
jgi:hypothetical protein